MFLQTLKSHQPLAEIYFAVVLKAVKQKNFKERHLIQLFGKLTEVGVKLSSYFELTNGRLMCNHVNAYNYDKCS